MKQNIYDNELFFSSYVGLRMQGMGLNKVLEIPAFRNLLPNLKDKHILDLGCGFGENAKWFAEQGAASVTAIDLSEKMIEKAKIEYAHEKVNYLLMDIEKIQFPAASFDVITSSLVFHYIKDFKLLVKKIQQCLKPGGILLFSQEHPIALAKKVKDGWHRDEILGPRHWIMDNYHQEGVRKQDWFVNNVEKYHRTMTHIINALVENRMMIDRMEEPFATKEAENEYPHLHLERRRPPFLMLRCKKG